ncbi:MAG: flavin reductase family protein [Myxococcales bacterium]|nr:flavin reductase family protein [Myxococcales bacterium]
MPVHSDAFKQGLRRWVSGVTVVTARAGDEMHGMTVSAFSSVSADPPLVLVCANRGSRTHRIIREGGLFAVNILASDQQAVSNTFASSADEDRRLELVPWHPGQTGVPMVDGALANLECRVVSAYDEGSHTIYIGDVIAAELRDADPLIYYGGSYRDLR